MYRMDTPSIVKTAKARSFNDRLADGLVKTRAVGMLESLARKPQLLVLNYHRIGDSAISSFDPGVFSTDASGFSEQIKALSRVYTFVTPSEALEVIEGKVTPKEPLLLLTFDDGYRDNFTQAYPVLLSYGLKAIFFVVTSYLESPQVPWWDRIAGLIRVIAKRGAPTNIPISRSEMLVIVPNNLNESIKRALSLFKTRDSSDQEAFELELRKYIALNGTEADSIDGHAIAHSDFGEKNLMMSWNDVKLLHAAGMTIGAHSHSHQILGRLDRDSQRKEILTSKRTLEDNLSSPVHFMAYPDGKRETFNSDTMSEAQSIGFRAVFSFYGGTNRSGRMHPFDVRRSSLSGEMTGSRLLVECARLGTFLNR
jgi:peptidoglycan/xylan/chitin deacetylase (PgdA/CDA1 family)